MKKVRFLFPLLFLLLFAGCTKGGCLQEAGSTVTTVRSTPPFHQIDLYDNIHLVLTQDTAERVAVEAGEYLTPHIATMVEEGILKIRNNAACKGLRSPGEKIVVHVSVKALDRINYAGSGDVRSTNTLVADHITFFSEIGAGNIEVSLDARHIGSYIMDENADFIFHGRSDVCHSYTNSRGTIDFSDFTVRKMVIEFGSVRDATIQVTEDLDAVLYFKGNLFYKGGPVVSRNIRHSSGRLIARP